MGKPASLMMRASPSRLSGLASTIRMEDVGIRASDRYLTGPWAARILGTETSMRILVVDDDPSVAEVIAEAIRASGDAALVALDGAEALDLLETTPVDGVFLDLVMPGLGGIATLARIRLRHPALPVVILSGHADEEQAREALSLGAVDVVKKPAALTHLSDALARLKGN
ncbi:MAG TPA: response regulator [Pseudomonadales bacterium]|nr:response regulator [Pseudomonadales bacterium]